MAKTETLEDFYRQKLNGMPDYLQKYLGSFNAFRVENHGLVSKFILDKFEFSLYMARMQCKG